MSHNKIHLNAHPGAGFERDARREQSRSKCLTWRTLFGGG